MSRGCPGRLFDGLSAAARPVAVEVHPDHLALLNADGFSEVWRLSELTLAAGDGLRGPVALARGEQRLSVDDASFRDALITAAPGLFPRRGLRAISHGGLVGVLAVAVLASLWFGIPVVAALIASHLPGSVESRIGKATTSALGLAACATSDQPGPLADLVTAVAGKHRFPFPLDVRMVRMKDINAIALPAGHILLFQELILNASSPDQVAGVLAHEFSHVEAGDPMRLYVELTGTEALFGLAFGQNSASAAIGRQLLVSAHTRDAEREADSRAVALLKESGLRSDGLSSFLSAFAADTALTRSAAYFLSHPNTDERVARLKAVESSAGRPALDNAAWKRLRHLCDG